MKTICRLSVDRLALFLHKHLSRLFVHKTVLSLLLLVLITLITHWRWFLTYEYFGYGDTSFMLLFDETWREHFSFPYLWSTRRGGFGELDIILSSYPFFYLLFGGLVTSGLDARIVSKLLYLIPVPLVSIIGSYLLIKYIFKSNLAGIVGALVYSYNVSFLLYQWGGITLSAGYAMAPLVLFFLLKGLETRKRIFLLLTGMVGFIEAAYEFRYFYMVAWVMVFLILFHALFIKKISNIVRIIKHFIYFSIPFIIIFLLNLYWILPFYKTGSIASNFLFDRGLFGNQFMNWRQSVTFFYPFWTGGFPSAFHVQPIPFYFWLIPIFALMGLILNHKNKLVIFFAFVSILGIILTKQADHPFPDLYLWLYNNFPGFNAYRESSKFYMLTALGYSVLIAAFVSWLQTKKNKNKLLILGKYLTILLICSLFLWNSRVLITGSIGGLFSSINKPQEDEKLKNFLNADREYSRTLWVPRFGLWSFYSNNHPRYSLYNTSAWNESLKKSPEYRARSYDTAKIAPDLYWIIALLDQNFSDNLLDITNTKYVIVPAQYMGDLGDDAFFGTGLYDRPFIVKFLDRLPFIKKIDVVTKNMMVYENYNFKPLIYVTSVMDNVYESVPYEEINYQFINPTEYLVEIKNISSPMYLNFNNSYAKDWGLDLGSGHYLPSKDHLQTNMLFNAFYIHPAEITKNYDKKFYTKNADGSISLKLRLYYKSQDLVNIGTYISLAGLISLLAYLFIDFFKIKDLLLRQLKFKRKKQ